MAKQRTFKEECRRQRRLAATAMRKTVRKTHRESEKARLRLRKKTWGF